MSNDIINKERIMSKMPKQEGFFQCAIFYGTPIANELEHYDERAHKKTPKLLKEELENQKFVFPFYSNEIFPTFAQAQAFFPEFINQLIAKKLIPADVIDDNKMLKDDICKAAVVPLKFSVIDTENTKNG